MHPGFGAARICGHLLRFAKTLHCLKQLCNTIFMLPTNEAVIGSA